MEKKQLISVVKPLIAAALLFGSSGGVAWGQTQMDCKNAFGAGESRSDGSVPAGTPAVPNRGGAGKITLETDSWLVSDPNNAPNTSIIIGTTSPNVVGEKWIFTGVLPPSQQGSSGGGWIDAYSGYHIGVNATSCYDHRNCGSSLHPDWRTASGSGTSHSESPVYTGCDNTFFRNHGGSYYRPNSNWAGADFTSNLETVVNIGSGTLGGSSVVGTSSTNAFDCDYFYFKNIPYQIKTITITGSNATAGPNGCASCQYTTYSKTITHPGGNVDQGRIVVDAGSHIHIRKNISADGGSGSKAVLDLPSGGNQYSLMVDGDINQAAVISRSGSGVINNLASMAPKAVIGVYGNYLPGSGSMGTDASGGGGTILIGPSTGGQNKMTIVASTQSSSNTYPHGFSSNGNTVYTGTCVPVDGSSNVGNYGTATPHDITIENTMTLPGTMGAGKLQVFNTGGNVDFKNKIPATGADGNVLLMAKGTFTMNSASTHTITMAAGNTSLMGGVVELKKKEDVKVDGSGDYNVFGFDAAGNKPTLGPLTWSYCGQPLAYSWCGNTERAEHIPHATPNIDYTLQPQITGQAYDGHCMPAFTGGGHIKSFEDSEVKVNSSGSARWQAMGHITTGNGKKLEWKVGTSSTGTASWLAKGNITLGTGNTTNWESATSSVGDRLFWNAGGDITTNDVIAKWKTSDGNMYWRAMGTIQAGSSGHELNTVEWKSTGKGNMLWEATKLNVVNGSNLLKFEQTGTGRTNWHAKGDINAKAGSGGITFTNSSTEANGLGTMTWLAGGNIITSAAGELIKFEQKTSATAGRNAWKAGNDIRTKSKIEFNNETSKYNMEWHACNDIQTNYGGTGQDGSNDFLVTFLNKKEGNVIWHANHDIITRSKTDFESTSTASGNITWYAGHDIHTYLG